MNNSNRILVFLLGLSLGLLAGASFFIFKFDNYISQLAIFTNAKDTIIALTQTTASAVIHRNIGSIKAEKTAVATTPSDSVAAHTVSGSQILPGSDSVTIDSTYMPKADNIIVLTDEFITAKTVEIRNLSSEKNTALKKTDSLLHALSGIRENDKLPGNFKVEFWQSPLNYKGFKMTKSKLLLYGINVYEGIALYNMDETIYLRSQQDIYKLDYTSDFKRFEAIKDPLLMFKIQQDNLLLQQ